MFPTKIKAGLISAVLLATAFPGRVYAALDWKECLIEENVATIKCLVPLFQNAATAAVAFIGVVLFVVLIIAGFAYLTAGGDPKKLEKAKGSLSGALLGIIIITLAYLIINFISEFTGVDEILNFDVIIKQ